VLALPQTKERFASLGAEVWAGTPQQFATFIRDDIAKWRRLAKQLDMKLE
jgi:tripartite-type tricarboxylate transporter receptor subunit TctC